MPLEDLIRPFSWTAYSRKVAAKIERPISYGRPNIEMEEKIRYVEGEAGAHAEGNYLSLTLVIDLSDRMIIDAKFFCFGHTALLAAIDALCTLIVGKSDEKARLIDVAALELALRDRKEVPSLPNEVLEHLELALEAFRDALFKCRDQLPLLTPLPASLSSENREGGYPDWENLSAEQQRALIEKILDEEVRPYIALDEGGIEILEILGEEVKISYQGNCTSCASSVGSTLNAIQEVLHAKLSPTLRVVPDLSSLHFFGESG